MTTQSKEKYFLILKQNTLLRLKNKLTNQSVKPSSRLTIPNFPQMITFSRVKFNFSSGKTVDMMTSSCVFWIKLWPELTKNKLIVMSPITDNSKKSWNKFLTNHMINIGWKQVKLPQSKLMKKLEKINKNMKKWQSLTHHT